MCPNKYVFVASSLELTIDIRAVRIYIRYTANVRIASLFYHISDWTDHVGPCPMMLWLHVGFQSGNKTKIRSINYFPKQRI